MRGLCRSDWGRVMADEPLFTREEVEALVYVFRLHDQSKRPRWVCAPSNPIGKVFE